MKTESVFDDEEDWACEARRYYFNIVGKFGAQVQRLLKKAAARVMKAQFESMKNITICDTVVTIKTRMTAENEKELEALATDILA